MYACLTLIHIIRKKISKSRTGRPFIPFLEQKFLKSEFFTRPQMKKATYFSDDHVEAMHREENKHISSKKTVITNGVNPKNTQLVLKKFST